MRIDGLLYSIWKDALKQQQLATFNKLKGLLAPEDLTAEPLDYAIQHVLDGAFPRRVDLGDALYAVHYDLPKRHVVLRLIKGSREKPPPLSFLPSFPGFRISVEAGRSLHVVRSRG